MRPARSRVAVVAGRTSEPRVTHHPLQLACAGVLVGGASTRFGRDKASALFAGHTLLNHHINVLYEAGCNEIVYVGGAPRSDVARDARHVPDATPGQGPLAGLLALLHDAHRSSALLQHAAVLMIACDIPLLSPATVQRVVAGLGDADVAVASAQQDHWSCLAVRVTQYHALLEEFKRGERSLRDATQRGSITRVACDEAEFLNVNDVDTLQRALLTVTNDHKLGR